MTESDNTKSPIITPRIFRGTHDALPEEMSVKRHMVEVIESVYMQYGFQPLETPALEFWDILTGKSGEEGDKLIYPLAYKGGKTLALRYDLTIPLARVIAMHPDIPMPFKRYQIQPVWRADRPQPHQGRFREFLQCDADVIGTESPLADAEILVMISEVLTALEFPKFVIRLSSRKILSGIVEKALGDAFETTWICRAIDKREKVGLGEVVNELVKGGLSGIPLDTIVKFMQIGTGSEALNKAYSLLESSKIGLKGVDEVKQVISGAIALGITPEEVKFDPTLARGLDYYTGAIYETVLVDHPHIGSITGGGRYDGLIGMFLGKEIPATGSTIGVDRMMAVMRQLNLIPKTSSSAKVLVVLFDQKGMIRSLEIAARLRGAGIATEVYPDPVRLKKQFQYADRKDIPYVVVPGPDEWSRGEVTLKSMHHGKQALVSLENLISKITKPENDS